MSLGCTDGVNQDNAGTVPSAQKGSVANLNMPVTRDDNGLGSGWADWSQKEQDPFIELFRMSFDDDMRRNNDIDFTLSTDEWFEILAHPILQPIFAKRKRETVIEWMTRADKHKDFKAVLLTVECMLEQKALSSCYLHAVLAPYLVLPSGRRHSRRGLFQVVGDGKF
jgi:hypothetical protein